MIKAAVLGCGNIGSGVVQVIEENQAQIKKVLPEGLEIKYILDLREFPGTSFEHKVVHDLDVILQDPEIRVICETMGGKEPAFTFSRKALERGISVCSSNKELVEAYGPVLLQTAREHNCSYLFEASVGGGIPLIHPMLTCLVQEDLDSVTGILNGTTNYILTKMEHEGTAYEEALREAQALGYAERNPAADVEGHDTGRKIAILASLMCGESVRYEDASVEGITAVTPEDFACAGANGYTIKLLGRAKLEDGHLRVLTAPFLVPSGHPLYSVNDVFNAVLLHGNMVDNVMFYGRGAGKLPTASAVTADMINAVKNQGQTTEICWDARTAAVDPVDTYVSAFYVRLRKKADLQEVFGEKLAAVWQDKEEETVFLTAPMPEGLFRSMAAQAGDVLQAIRVL